MRPGGDHRQHGRFKQHGPQPHAGSGAPTPASLPFDYSAAFPITGQPGTVREAVINISPEGPFTALGVSYGFEQNRGRSIGAFLPAGLPIPPGDLTLGDFPIDVLIDGVRVGPRYLTLIFETQATARGTEFTGRFSPTPIVRDVLNQAAVFEHMQPPADIEFFFTIIDTASGREMQDQPAFNVASLGDARGKRPFRHFPAPIHFGARATVRAQIVERSAGIEGTLFLNLFGLQRSGACAPPPPQLAPGDSRVIPFDYVSRVSLTGRDGNRIEDEVAVNAEGGFFATSIGYGLQTNDPAVEIAFSGSPSTIDLNAVRLNQLPPDALIDGFRIAPGFTRFAVSPSGALNTTLPASLAGRVLESLNRPQDVSFRYSLFDSAAGRELQNQPIHNVAGLGVATGERPFKRLANPLHFSPRATFRLTVDEHFGRGELYFVLQGYKILEGAARGAR